MHCVVYMTATPYPLRVAAAVILGIITGGIFFFIVALIAGAVNDMAKTNLPVSTNVAENIFSAILLIALVVICVAVFYRKVATTPPSEGAGEPGPAGISEDELED
jgi:preprotein translocase subunit SecY